MEERQKQCLEGDGARAVVAVVLILVVVMTKDVAAALQTTPQYWVELQQHYLRHALGVGKNLDETEMMYREVAASSVVDVQMGGVVERNPMEKNLALVPYAALMRLVAVGVMDNLTAAAMRYCCQLFEAVREEF